MISIRYIDGPLAGRLQDVPAGTETIDVGKGIPFWTYTYAGKDNGQVLFAKRPRSRTKRRFVTMFIGEVGQHPAVAYVRQEPVRGGTTDKRGQGARRRAAAR